MGVLTERILFLSVFIIIPPLLLAILMIFAFDGLITEGVLAIMMLSGSGIIFPFIGGTISTFGINNGGERLVIGFWGGGIGGIIILIFVMLILQGEEGGFSELMLGSFVVTVICSTIGAQISPRY